MKKPNSELDFFALLSSKEKAARLNSTRGILRKIKHTAKSSNHDVYLICKRLIRGLGGSNPVFRQGCFTSVVGLLSLLPSDFDLKLIEEIIENELSPTGNNSKLEEGEAFMGQTLAYGSMIMSDFIFNKSKEEQSSIFEKLFHISKKRSYLHHGSFVFMTMYLKKARKEITSDGLVEHLKDLSTDTFDKLNYILTIVDLKIKTNLIEKVFKTKSFFDPANIKKIIILFKKYKSKHLLEHEFYTNFAKAVTKNSQFLKLFWSNFVENTSKNEEEKPDKFKSNHDYLILHLGNQLFNELCINENHAMAIELFNQNFINVILRNTKKEKQLVGSILDHFCKVVKLADDDSKLGLIEQMILSAGLINFDNLTNSKTIMTLTNSLTFKGISKLVDLYKDVIESRKQLTGLESRNKGVIMCINFYTKIINNPSCCDEVNWRLDQLIYLLKLGYFKPTEIYLNRELVQNIQESFLTSLGHRFPNLESFHKVIEGIVTNMDKMLSNEKTPSVVVFTDEMMVAWKNAISLSEKMNKVIRKDSENKEIILVLKMILQYMALMLLKEQSTAVTNIDDLKNIFEEFKKKEGDSENRMWIQVLIDIFLNLLSKPKYHHRHLIRCIFKFICPFLTIEAFQQITEVLSLSYEDSGVDEDEENESSSDTSEDSSDSEEEMEEDEDGEEISKNEKLRFELRNALGGGSDNESIDIDDMEEEEGKKLDETLSHIFRANFKRKKNDHLSKYQNQLMHFRTRVMDLIEICTEVVLPLPYWLQVLLPLVDLLGSTIGNNKLESLRAKIKCCIKKLNSSKIVIGETKMDDVVDILENVFDKASKSSGVLADIKSELIMVIKFLLKSSKTLMSKLKPNQLEKNGIFQCYKKYLESFFTSKNSLPGQLFTGLASMGWDGIFVSIPYIIECSFDENIKYYKRSVGLKIVELFYKTPQYFDGHLEKYYDFYLPNIEAAFTNCFTGAMNNMSQNKEINMKFCTELYSLINYIIVRQRNSQQLVMINKDKIKLVLEANLKQLPSMKGKCKQTFKKLTNNLTLNIGVNENEMSMTTEISSDNSPGTKNKLLKRKRKGDVLGKKKKLKTLKVTYLKNTSE